MANAVWNEKIHCECILGYRCSNCGGEALDIQEYPYKSKYCPHCGARMMNAEENGRGGRMSKDLYKFVGTRIRAFCDKTYYSDIVFSFEQSYDGEEWTKEIEFATLHNGADICYENDWNEGQTYIRNLRIWHLEDSEPVVHCKDCKWCEGEGFYCEYERLVRTLNDFCSRGEKVSKYYE